MRRVAIVSPYFPPSTLAGVHRARLIARHLPAHGWEPTVVCVDERYHEEPLDPALARTLPPGLRIVKTPALPSSWLRPVGVGDLGLRAYWFLRRALSRLLAAGDTDVVLITGSPFYPMLLARWVRRRFGLPVVLDFQDPWVYSPGSPLPVFSKARAALLLAELLEPRAVAAADHIVAVSSVQNDELAARRRHALRDRTRMSAIPIGGDAGDFAYAKTEAWRVVTRSLPADAVTFSYVGTYWDRARPVFAAVLMALARLRAGDAALAQRTRLVFIGTSGQPGGFGRHRVLPLARAAGVDDLVLEVPQRIPYFEALGAMASSTALLLVGSEEPHFTASKVYPALASGRPTLAIYHRSSTALDVAARGGARIVPFASAADLDASVPAIAAHLADLARESPNQRSMATPIARDASSLAEFSAEHIAARFAAIFDGLVPREFAA